MQLTAVRSLYHTSQQRNKQLEVAVVKLTVEVAKAHDGHRAQHAAADRLLAIAAAAIAEGRLGQQRVKSHEQQLAAVLATVRDSYDPLVSCRCGILQLSALWTLRRH